MKRNSSGSKKFFQCKLIVNYTKTFFCSIDLQTNRRRKTSVELCCPLHHARFHGKTNGKLPSRRLFLYSVDPHVYIDNRFCSSLLVLFHTKQYIACVFYKSATAVCFCRQNRFTPPGADPSSDVCAQTTRIHAFTNGLQKR